MSHLLVVAPWFEKLSGVEARKRCLACSGILDWW